MAETAEPTCGRCGHYRHEHRPVIDDVMRGRAHYGPCGFHVRVGAILADYCQCAGYRETTWPLVEELLGFENVLAIEKAVGIRGRPLSRRASSLPS